MISNHHTVHPISEVATVEHCNKANLMSNHYEKYVSQAQLTTMFWSLLQGDPTGIKSDYPSESQCVMLPRWHTEAKLHHLQQNYAMEWSHKYPLRPEAMPE